MKVAFFSTKSYERAFFEEANRKTRHDLTYFEARLMLDTVPLAQGETAVCCFVNDQLDADVLSSLSGQGIRLIALRCAGFNHVDLQVAAGLKLVVVRVPAYSPQAVAEHAVGLIMVLNRKIHRAYTRVREGNFSLQGLLGFNLGEQTVGIIGTGKIGVSVARILKGFGCRLLGHDPYPDETFTELGGDYVTLSQLVLESDVISLHCPLTPETHHIINQEVIAGLKPGVMLVNTSRGALIDTRAVIAALKSGKIGSLGLDVYEEEADLFFEDYSEQIIQDDVFARLLTFPNVVVTGHQGFFTRRAMQQITETTLENITEFEKGESCQNQVRFELLRKG